MQPTERGAPHGSPDPTTAEIKQLCTEVRRGWSARVERERRVEQVELVVCATVAVEDIGLERQSIGP